MPQRHSAKFSAEVLAAMRPHIVEEGQRLDRLPVLLDPCAGVGGIHIFQDVAGIALTWGNELEPEYANEHDRTKVGDSRATEWLTDTFDIIATSVVYPNGMCDQFEASNPEARYGYRQDLRRPLTPGNAALAAPQRRITREYLAISEGIYRECVRVAHPGALWLINVSNHYRDKGATTEYVVRQHLNLLLLVGLDVVQVERVHTRRMKNGKNREVRFPWEHLLVMRGRG